MARFRSRDLPVPLAASILVNMLNVRLKNVFCHMSANIGRTGRKASRQPKLTDALIQGSS
jgi:hypothetical protein